MKKIFVAMLAVALTFTITGTVMAGKLKPPKNLCVVTSPGGAVFNMGIKKGTKLVIQDMKIEMYTVQGILEGRPFSGSGYMNGDAFYFQFNTTYAVDIEVHGTWNIEDEEGDLTLNTTNAAGFESTLLDIVPCGTL